MSKLRVQGIGTLLLFFLATSVLANEKTDPQYCAYWLRHLDEISECERHRIEIVPEIEKNDGRLSACDYDIDMGDKIRAIMKKLSKGKSF